jgi:hypothetical protein
VVVLTEIRACLVRGTNSSLYIQFVPVLLLLLLLLLLLNEIALSLGGSSPYTSANKANKNKHT